MSVEGPVELLRDAFGTSVLRLRGAYTIFDVERILRTELTEGGPLVVDLTQAETDHSALNWNGSLRC